MRRLFELSGKAISGLSYLKCILKVCDFLLKERVKTLQQKDFLIYKLLKYISNIVLSNI